jgi:cardiolipin synthase
MLQQALNPLAWLVLLHLLLWLGISARVLLRPDLSPDVRVAWLLVLLLLPYGGVLLYFLFGEVYLGRALARQQKAVLKNLRLAVAAHQDWGSLWQMAAKNGAKMGAQTPAAAYQPWQAASTYAHSVNGFALTQGNAAELLPEADARARLLRDIDAARAHIHLLYYIWLPDATGSAIAQALMRAAQRGVACRVLVDALGSRLLLASPLWAQMQAAGVQTAVALPFRWWQPLRSGRFDVRNHRKVCVIDGLISHVGSQNCADAAFAIKAAYAPWVDVMLRVQGAVVAQNQLLFISDWLLATGQNFDALAHTVLLPSAEFAAVAAQVVAAGPASRPRSTAQFLVTLLSGAQRQLWISTPYFVPDATVLQALCAAAWRGVDVRLILPARNDSWVVAAASRSHYASLLAAGVQIFEYQPGLLHAKTLTLDGQAAFIGSTNIDMRSFGLNYENNMLLQDAPLTAAIMQRQREYCSLAKAVTQTQVQGWSRPKRIWNNVWAAVSPLL